jgi:hypothetical protein
MSTDHNGQDGSSGREGAQNGFAFNAALLAVTADANAAGSVREAFGVEVCAMLRRIPPA